MEQAVEQSGPGSNPGGTPGSNHGLFALFLHNVIDLFSLGVGPFLNKHEHFLRLFFLISYHHHSQLCKMYHDTEFRNGPFKTKPFCSFKPEINYPDFYQLSTLSYASN